VNKEPETTEAMVLPQHPVASMVAQGLRLVQIENDRQSLTAVQRPRKEEEAFEKAFKELTSFPEFAKKAYYSIPYKDRSEGQEKTVLVEGPSIKAAMSLARRWGNNFNGARVVDETDDKIMVEGVFLDYETNMKTSRHKTVSKSGWSRKTQSTYRLREDKLANTIDAAMSKAVRNAIISSLPVALVDAYVTEAKKIAAGAGAGGKSGKKESTAERIRKAADFFVKKGASREKVEEYIQGLAMETDEDVLAHLIGLWNAIEEGQQTLEIFGLAEEMKAPVSGGQVRVGDLLGDQ
jgi:hypothetical protein